MYEKYLFPYILDSMMMRPPLMQKRRELLLGVSGDTIDVGIGTGANLFAYPDNIKHLTVSSKSNLLHPKVHLRAKEQGVTLTSVDTLNSPWPIEDNSFDTVVLCLTLCSVSDEMGFLLEIKRILRPKGVLFFMEHGHAPDKLVRVMERTLNPMNKIIGCGCSMTKMPVNLLSSAGFGVDVTWSGYLPDTPKSGGFVYLGKATK